MVDLLDVFESGGGGDGDGDSESGGTIGGGGAGAGGTRVGACISGVEVVVGDVAVVVVVVRCQVGG